MGGAKERRSEKRDGAKYRQSEERAWISLYIKIEKRKNKK